MNPNSIVGACIFVVVLALTRIASAQGCECICPADYGSTAARDQGLGPFVVNGQMPSNARIFAWLADYDPRTVRVVSEREGREIPVVLEMAAPDVPGAFWVSFGEPLVSPGVYTISVSGPPAPYPYETYFDSSGRTDGTVPAVGEARALRPPNHEYCEDLVGARLDSSVTAELGTIPIYEVELLRSGEVVGHTFSRGTFGTSPAPGCFGEAHVAGLVEGEELAARARVWDSAGNVSGFVTFPLTPLRAAAGSDRPCGGCTVVGAVPRGTSPWAALLALLGGAGVASRRARAREPSNSNPW